MTATLHAVRSTTPVSLVGALQWLATSPGGGEAAVGFTYSAAEARWFRLAGGGTPTVPDGTLSPDGVFEAVAFDGQRELRWLATTADSGHAVLLAEDTALLPPGVEATDPRHPTAFGSPRARILAGTPTPLPDRWLRLSSPRYAAAAVPVALPDERVEGTGADQPVVLLESVEYAVSDDHGNLTVTDHRRTRLRLTTRRQLRTDAPRRGASRATDRDGRSR